MNGRDCRHISIRQHSTFLRRINRLTLKTHRRRLGKSKSQDPLQRHLSSGLSQRWLNNINNKKMTKQQQKICGHRGHGRTILFNSFSIYAQTPFGCKSVRCNGWKINTLQAKRYDTSTLIVFHTICWFVLGRTFNSHFLDLRRVKKQVLCQKKWRKTGGAVMSYLGNSHL